MFKSSLSLFYFFYFYFFLNLRASLYNLVLGAVLPGWKLSEDGRTWLVIMREAGTEFYN